MESFEKKGIWWIPEHRARAVGGILSFSHDEGLRLELLGALREDISDPFVSLPVLFGYVDGLGEVTLGRCLSGGMKISMPGPVYEAYWPSIAFMGAHIPAPLEHRFRKARVEFTHLVDWMQRGGILLKLARGPAPPTPIIAEYTHLKSVRSQLPFGTLEIEFAGRTDGDLIHRFTILQDVHVDVSPREPLDMDGFLEDVIGPLQAFLAFATERAVNVTKLTVFSDSYTTNLSDKRTTGTPIDVFLRLRDLDEVSTKRLYPHDLLFSYRDIEDQFDTLVERWFRLFSDIPHCVNLLSGTYYSPQLHADRVFLVLAQVSEIFHRSRFKRKKLPSREFDRRQGLVNELNPSWLAKWISKQLNNELWFGQRLHDLFREYGECVLPLCSDRDAFVRSVVDTRNYYTHYSSGLKDKAAKGMDLYMLSQALSTLVKCCLLADLGVPAKARRRLLLRNQAYISILQESKNSEFRELFVSDDIEQRNQRIRSAVAKGKLTQREIASLVGLSPSMVSRIVRAQ